MLIQSPGSVTPVALVWLAYHPHAAMLFMDFVLSEEGQKTVVVSGRIPTR
jgi:ABC-type Fe3+ transport system substrate-binding protein